MQYDKNRFKIWALPHPFVLLWVLFPGTMFFELISGLRLPKVVLVDKESDKPQMERSYVPCPHCETLNDRRLWAAFGHWFGLVCPSCHQIIPCLWNIFSLAILTITFPLWYFPARFFRQRWLEKEKERLANVSERPLSQAKSMHWLLIFPSVFASAVSMWVMWVIFEVLWNGKEWDLKTTLESLPMWIVVGFATGLFMSWIEKDKEKAKERLANVPERPLIRAIRAKSINWFEFRWFVRGTFYFGGFMWVALGVWDVWTRGKWGLMFDMLPVCLLLGFIWGAFMQVSGNLLNLLDEPKRKKGRKT